MEADTANGDVVRNAKLANGHADAAGSSENNADDDDVPVDQPDDDGWLDVLENGQLKKKTLREGDRERARPERASKVRVSLTTRVKDGDAVPSETFDDRVGFVGDYDFMHGVDLAIPLMYPGEIAQLVIAPRFGYGEHGKEPDVPPHATLECELSLIDNEWIEIESDLTLDDRIKYGMLASVT